jgi:hypothetical protein
MCVEIRFYSLNTRIIIRDSLGEMVEFLPIPIQVLSPSYDEPQSSSMHRMILLSLN